MTTVEARLHNGRRTVDAAVDSPFHIRMRNDFLTPRGTPYKWQELIGRYSRAVAGAGIPSLVPVRYTWRSVHATTGGRKAADDCREWTFARGQGFNSALMHAETTGPPPPGPAVRADPSIEVSYPGLPKSPAVDLLLMLSWDVVMFEVMCTHMITTPALRQWGVAAELERISGTWANLRFSGPSTDALFRNSTATATLLGHGMRAGRPAAVYGYRCLDCELAVRTGHLEQKGGSSYWGTVHVDVETGDLLAADMTEMIVATLSGPDGQRLPVQKRRIVELAAGAGPSTPDTAPALTPAPAVDPELLADAEQEARWIAGHIKYDIDLLAYLPETVASRAVMGFRSLVGTDLAGAFDRISSLQLGLGRWRDGDREQAAAVYHALPSHRQTLEGLLAFGQIAMEEADRLDLRDAESLGRLHHSVTTARDSIAALLTLLDRIGG